MKKMIQKWGNVYGLEIPKTFLDELNLKLGDKVLLTIKNNSLVLEKNDDVSSKTIKELFKGFNGKYEKVDVEWGNPQGKEVL